MEQLLNFGRRIIPKSVFDVLAPIYHFILAWMAAWWFGIPSRHLKVIGITGTKGKSTVVYLISKLFEAAGEPVASVGSLGYKIKDREWPNISGNTMPGRFQIQKFLYDAKRAGVRYVVLEVTSEGIEQFRHIGINFDCAVFTNLEPEHIERHGGFENYYRAKQKLFKSTKHIHILNKESQYLNLFDKFKADIKLYYSGEVAHTMRHQFLGEFNLQNIAAAVEVLSVYGVPENKIREALLRIPPPPGRLQEIKSKWNFKIYVDYAHTPRSLEEVYKTLKSELIANDAGSAKKLICVLSATGGSRDKWKRPEFGKIAAKYCGEIILTNEDPYDENPEKIIEDIASGFIQNQNYEKIIDRGDAIKKALELAKKDDIVIITGKGSEKLMHIAGGKTIPWSDAEAVKDALASMQNK